MMFTNLTCWKLLYCEIAILFFTSICGFWLYMILAPSDLVYKIIPSTKIWELRATPLWQEPPPKSQFHDTDWGLGPACNAFMVGATFSVPIPRYQIEIWELCATLTWWKPPLESLSHYIGLWGELLVCLYGYYPIITWIYG